MIGLMTCAFPTGSNVFFVADVLTYDRLQKGQFKGVYAVCIREEKSNFCCMCAVTI